MISNDEEATPKLEPLPLVSPKKHKSEKKEKDVA